MAVGVGVTWWGHYDARHELDNAEDAVHKIGKQIDDINDLFGRDQDNLEKCE